MQRTVIPTNFDEQNGFETISAFKSCMKWHGEVEFVWNGVSYSITHYNGKSPFVKLISRKQRFSVIQQMKFWNTWLVKIAFGT